MYRFGKEMMEMGGGLAVRCFRLMGQMATFDGWGVGYIRRRRIL